MMRKFIVLGFLGLSGCSTVNQDNMAACISALFSAGTSNIAALAGTAAVTPACRALAADVIQTLIHDISKKQLARGVR